MKTLWAWVTTHALKWNRLAWGAALLYLGMTIIEKLAPKGVDIPTEAFWLAMGVILAAFAQALTSSEAGKSEVLTLAEQSIARDKVVAEAKIAELEAEIASGKSQ